jgi:hypothetical protein
MERDLRTLCQECAVEGFACLIVVSMKQNANDERYVQAIL